MTGIAEFIREQVLLPRLKMVSVLAVYDPDRRYRDICIALAGSETAVIDAGEDGIEAREAAMLTLAALGKPNAFKQELVYIPAKPPMTDEQRQEDPFSVYAACGAMFPEGDGDEYLCLCLKAKPDYVTEVRRLFAENPSPPFALIDNIGGGLSWPTLRTCLQAESAKEIILALLVPTQKQTDQLKTIDGWVPEARLLLEKTLGLKLSTKGRTWSPIAAELWRYLLYSDFAFDLPIAMPSPLANVPRAPDEARPLVEDLCEALRTGDRTRAEYIERAEAVESELHLPEHFAGAAVLGGRDTFVFQERIFLASAVTALVTDKIDTVRSTIDRHGSSVWIGKGESQAQWGLAEAALRLVEVCDDVESQLADHSRSLDALIQYYVGSLREADRLQREFEQAVNDYTPIDGSMSDAVEHCRRRYGKLAEKVQGIFTKHFESSGWPLQRRLANADVFDRVVAPMLKDSGRRVAYILVDALRYELGVTLHRQLAETEQAEIQATCAQLPTVTPVGMASLLPGAGAGLKLVKDGDGFGVTVNEKRIASVPHRMEAIRCQYGDRFAESTLENFIRSKAKTSDTVELLVLRTLDIDSHLESNPATTLGLIHQSLKGIRVAVHKLKGMGFSDVVIATDHGFFLNAHAEAGNVCSKPGGNWIVVHDRALLGEGESNAANFAIAAERAGIRGDFAKLAGPRSMAPYKKGLLYFHGGASLQEAIVPVLTVKLRQPKQPEIAAAKVVLSYKNGARKVTTRLPVVTLSVEGTDMFSLGSDFEILLEAHDRKGAIIGEAKPGGPVDVATGTVRLKPGGQVQVTVRMSMEFDGKFTLKALNPMTMAMYSSLELETDYAV